MLVKTRSLGARILRAIADFVDPESAYNPLEHQMSLWRRLREYRYLLTERELALFNAIEVSLDAGYELHPKYARQLGEMYQRVGSAMHGE